MLNKFPHSAGASASHAMPQQTPTFEFASSTTFGRGAAGRGEQTLQDVSNGILLNYKLIEAKHSFCLGVANMAKQLGKDVTHENSQIKVGKMAINR